jgi:Tol biopolymer transport system component
VLLLTAGVVACRDGDDGDGANDGCGDDSLVVAFDHETIDPDRGIGGGVPEISVAAQGGDPEMITGDWVVSQPDFSPDGDRLVVVKADGDYESAGPNATALWVIGTDGIDATEPRELTSGDVLDEDPDWSPDGATIAFSRTVFDPVREVFDRHIMTIPAEGGEPRALVSSMADGDRLDEPAWSPDGARLAYIRSVQEAGSLEEATTVWTMAADGSDVEAVVTLPYIEDIGWHPDGTSLVVTTGDGAHSVDMDSGTAERLTDEAGYVAWAPDGEHLYHATKAAREEGARGIRRSLVEDGALVDTEEIVTARHPWTGFAVGPCA